VSKPEAPFVGKIRRSLTGLTEAEGVPGWLGSRFFRSGQPLPRPDLYRSITQPPSYMVFIVLGMAGLRYHKEEDKSAWQFHVAFEGDSFWVSDWKRYAWSVDAASDDDATRERARRLVKKITNACGILDREIRAEAERMIAHGEFFLHNPHAKVKRTYSYFRDRVEKGAKKEGAPPRPAEDFSLTRIFEEAAELSFDASAMVAFFFSYCELVLDALFAFDGSRTETLTAFRKLTWSERCSRVLPLDDKKLKPIYDELLAIKKDSRDEMLHGYGGEERILIPMPGLGLIPTSYEHLGEKVHSFIDWSSEDALRAVRIFDSFEEWIATDPRTQYALMFLRTGRAIPFQAKRLTELRSWMTSPDEFREALDEEGRYEDYASEQY